MKTTFTVKCEIDAEGIKRLEKIAKKSGYRSAREWITKEAGKLIERTAKDDPDLTPEEVSGHLRIGRSALGALIKQRSFKGLYYVNSRIIRIPQYSLERFKWCRTPQCPTTPEPKPSPYPRPFNRPSLMPRKARSQRAGLESSESGDA